MKTYRVFIGLLFITSACTAAEPELSLNGYKIGDDFQTVEARAKQKCESFEPQQESLITQNLVSNVYKGIKDEVWNCMSPEEDEINATKLNFEFQNNKLVTIFAWATENAADKDFQWLVKKFGSNTPPLYGADEVSNALEMIKAEKKLPGAEDFAYFDNRHALVRWQFIEGQYKNTYIYVMDGVSQKISPIHASSFR